MKRKISILVMVLMLWTTLLPTQGFAAEGDKGLENAIKVAKEKFRVPENFKFDYNVGSENGKSIWYLSWNSEDGMAGGINVRINEDGTVLGYDNYKPRQYPRQKKFPDVSRQEALKIADAFIQKINPAAFSQVKYRENEQNTLQEYSYYFTYVRTVNGLPLYENSITISVNSETGEVEHYSYIWNDGLSFPAINAVITAEAAQKAYEKNLGLRLQYNGAYSEDGVRPYAVYAPVYNPNGYFIDALTGNKVQTSYGYRGAYYDLAAGMKVKNEAAKSQPAEPVLTPAELKAVEEASKLLTAAEAEKIARKTGVLELTADYKLSGSNLSRRWPLKGEFSWYLNFNKDAAGKTDDYRNVSVTIDAKTGEIQSFYSGYPYKEGEKAVYDKNASKKAAEDFLKSFNYAKFSQTEYDDANNDIIFYMGKEDPRNYSFTYIRKVNGVRFPGNTITVRFDAVKGKVESFDLNWYPIEFPPVAGVISTAEAYSRFYSQVGLELEYKLKYPEPDTSVSARILPVNSEQKPEVIPVYAVKTNKPYTIDANTGVLLDYDGNPYKEVKTAKYTDISGHFAEKQITALAEYGIMLEGDEFKPDTAILQKDYVSLLSQILNYYYLPPIRANSSGKEIDDMYNTLIREGVVKPEEKAPQSAVSREDAVKFMIRGLKYNEVADLKDIFKSSFKDESKINPDLTGYVAIAGGLKIIGGNDGYFRPKDALTRAEAMVMIYNYLQR